MKIRYLQSVIEQDLKTKMVFLAGPRQVGKTTLARMTPTGYSHTVYLNWDNPYHREKIDRMQWSPDADMLILDEVHKNPNWKNLVKGIWDTRTNDMHVLVTGSSKLNIFRKGGDSLSGRYHLHRLHPFSVKEYSAKISESFKIQHEINEKSMEKIAGLQVRFETEKKEREAEIYRLKNVELSSMNAKLRDALAHVKKLQGMLPICANCKKVRDDDGYWQQIEAYISDHSDVKITHGICPECIIKLYGEEFAREEQLRLLRSPGVFREVLSDQYHLKSRTGK